MSFLASLVLAVLNAAPTVVTVHCADACTAKLDGRAGRTIDPQTSAFADIAPGSRKLEVAGKGGPLFVGFVEVPGGDARIELDADGRASVAASAPAEAAAPTATANPSAPSTVRVRCPNDCTVTVDGRSGRRLGSQEWEVANVAPGDRRVEAQGLWGMALGSGFIKVPPGSDVEVSVSSTHRVTLGKVSPRAGEAQSAGGPSSVRVLCPKSCTVYVDHQRRSAEGAGALVLGVTPGSHLVEARYLFTSASGLVQVPADSEVLVVAGDSSVRATSAKPLAH